MSNPALTPSKYLLPDEQASLEASLAKYRRTSPRNTLMILLMLRTGARPQELLNLTWSDISWSSGRIFFSTLKGGRDRVIPVPPSVLARLKELGPGEGKIFKIKYWMFHSIWRQYRPVEKKLHSLRHTFAVNLYRKSGYDLPLVQRALGHKNLSTTAIYLEIEMCSEKLERILVDE